MKKNNILLLVVIILILLFFAFYSIKDMFTPYVSFNKAKSVGEYVQIIGKLKKDEKLVYKNNGLYFTIKDNNNQEMNIFYKGVVPLNFNHADQVVAIGIYDKNDKVFKADKILVKCPSKYQRGNK